MTIRRIRPEEYAEADNIKRVAFLRTVREEQKNDADVPEEIYRSLWAYFDENNKMTARVRDIEYTMFFDGHAVGMCGISAVSSLPEARGKGRVREILQAILSESREEGKVFSVLSPFSQPYYQQFGYAKANRVCRHTVALEQLMPYAKTPFCARLHQLEDGVDAFDAVHNAASRRYNMALMRTPRQWKKMMGGDPYIHKDYRYVFYDAQDKPVGYLIFSPNGGEPLDIIVTDLDYLDQNALFGMLSFLSGLRAQVRNVTLKMPAEAKFHLYLPNSDLAKTEMITHDMARVLHVEKALSLCKMPQEKGAFTIAVRDEFLTENSGVYRVAYQDGRAVSVEKTQAEADLSLDIADFTQLVLGVLPLPCMLYRPTVTLHAPEKLSQFQAVFPEKAVYMADHF